MRGESEAAFEASVEVADPRVCSTPSMRPRSPPARPRPIWPPTGDRRPEHDDDGHLVRTRTRGHRAPRPVDRRRHEQHGDGEGPSAGVTAQLYQEDGTLSTTVPLVDGAGIGPLPSPSPAPRLSTVRVLDGRVPS
ncbi:MAG: hypothetical protein M3Q22_11005 [Actinomycetota bacterium]|nr:hypothetical protein [Actinomycetota bacterium]